MPSLSISRTIYDPSTKDFITSTPDAKAMPNIKQWINQHNPVIYWYVLRIDNPTDTDIFQWAVELYAHQALTITEAYIDGSDRKFELRKRERDPWSEKYVLSIPRQVAIPLIGKGTRRIYFKVDIDCKEGLMHEYGISGRFVAQGMEPAEIREKMFHYSCKVGEFRQIFDKDPHQASSYAEKKLAGKYSSNSVHVFTNSFRMIHELYGYCHSKRLDRDVLLQKLHLLHTSFEGVPEIAGERISPLIHDGIRELDVIVDRDKFAPRFIRLCDSLVELLHMEVMGADMIDGGADAYTPPPEPVRIGGAVNGFGAGGQKECPACGNIITESNKSLICMECGARFCHTCEGWFRKDERKRGEGPSCKKCYTAEQDRIREEAERKVQLEQERKEKEEQERQRKEEAEKKARNEAERKKKEEEERLERERKQKEEQEERLKAEQEKQAREEAERKKREEDERKRKEAEERDRKAKEEHEKLAKEGNSIGMKFAHIPAGEFMMGSDEFGYEKPVHKVNISKPFCLGTYPVTQHEWKVVMGDNPSRFKGDDLPVEQVSWNDAQEFIKKINKKEGADKYRLPSEAEWEYACRAGTSTRYSFGDDEGRLGEYAWYDGNLGSSNTHPVGKKKPNPWGLYDMHGNVWEWVQDEWHDDYEGAPSDGSAWEDGGGSNRVYRGGCWRNLAQICRSAFRSDYDPAFLNEYLGFRLLREL